MEGFLRCGSAGSLAGAGFARADTAPNCSMHQLISAFGTKPTRRAGLAMSVDWGRPEVAGGASNRRK